MHHAKKAEASGFCYMNDIVLAILELLRVHARVLYVDIDIHHGDGVEEAFYLTDRVMTVSFHKYGDFFPGTGALGDVGHSKGKFYSLNGPLREGIDDESYEYMFRPIMTKVMEHFQPGAIVVCGGADSLSGDRLGCFNLSMEGHATNLDFLKSFGVPLLLLGGGGYTMRNVARCWAFETGRMLGVDMEDTIPESALKEYNYYQDTSKLRIQVSNMKNANTREDLDKIIQTCLQNLQRLPAAPSASFHHVPDPIGQQDENGEGGMAAEEDGDPDARGGGLAAMEKRAVRNGDDEKDGGVEGNRVEYNPREDAQYEGPPQPAKLADAEEEGKEVKEVKEEDGGREGAGGGEDHPMS